MIVENIKEIDMKMITTPQLKKIHTLLGELGIKDRKPEIVYSFTHGRTESSRDMTLMEAKALIEYLMGSQERTTVIRRIWHLAYEMGIIVPGDQDEKAMNAAKLDAFCEQRGTVKKPLSCQSLKEVKRTAKQFEAMFAKHEQRKEDIEILESLKKSLAQCVATENYEVAARIKVEIELQNELLAPKRKRAVKAV